MNNQVSIRSWFVTGWRTYEQRPGMFLLASVLIALVPLPFAMLPRMRFGNLLSWILTPFILPVWATGVTYFYLRAVRGEDTKLGNLFAGFQQFRRVWCAGFLVNLLVTGGVILFVLPGIIWSLKYAFSALAALDQRLAPTEALRSGAQLTRGYKWHLVAGIAIGLCILLPSMPGSFAFFKAMTRDTFQVDWSSVPKLSFSIAIIWGILIGPWLSATTAAAYENLRQQAEHKSPVVTTPWTWTPAYLGGIALLWTTVSTFRNPHATQEAAKQLEQGRTERQARAERKEPVVYLPFDGTSADVGAYGFHTEMDGMPVSFGPGAKNQAGLFDGNSFLSSRIYVSADQRVSLAGGATIEVWFKRNADPFTPGETLFSVSGGGGNLSLGLSTNGELRGRLGQVIVFGAKDATVSAHNQPVSMNEWTHAALVYDAQQRTLSLFTNGKRIDQANDVPTRNHWYPIALGVGAWASPKSGPFHGWIDECKVYEFARTAEEIAISATLK